MEVRSQTNSASSKNSFTQKSKQPLSKFFIAEACQRADYLASNQWLKLLILPPCCLLFNET
jgi:hypothetical protein